MRDAIHQSPSQPMFVDVTQRSLQREGSVTKKTSRKRAESRLYNLPLFFPFPNKTGKETVKLPQS